MPSFEDATGHSWDLDLNLAAAERIDTCDFSLLTDEKICILNPDEKLFEILTTNTAVIFACIWCIISPETKKMGITQDDFKERINGSVIHPAKKAFWGALQDFFPEHKIVLSKLVEMLDKAMKTREKQVKELMPEMERAVDNLIDNGFKTMKEELRKT